MVTIDFTSESSRTSRAGTLVGALSCVDHHCPAGGGRTAQDQTRGQMDVGLVARNVNCRRHRRRGRHGQHECASTGRERQRGADFKSGRERAGTRHERHVSARFREDRQRPIVHARFEQRCVLDEGDLGDAGAEDLTVHPHRRASRRSGDTNTNVGAGQRRGRRDIDASRPARRKIEQPIVFGAGHRDRAGRAGRHGCLGECGRVRNNERDERQQKGACHQRPPALT
jgi:hypothetical protein